MIETIKVPIPLQKQRGKESSISLFKEEDIKKAFQSFQKKFHEYKSFEVRAKSIYKDDEEVNQEKEQRRKEKMVRRAQDPVQKKFKPSKVVEPKSTNDSIMEIESSDSKPIKIEPNIQPKQQIKIKNENSQKKQQSFNKSQQDDSSSDQAIIQTEDSFDLSSISKPQQSKPSTNTKSNLLNFHAFVEAEGHSIKTQSEEKGQNDSDSDYEQATKKRFVNHDKILSIKRQLKAKKSTF